MDVSKLKVADLKKELKSRGLSTNGAKNELIERLQESLRDESTDNTVLENDDLLDEEAVLADETDEAILDEPSTQLNSQEDDVDLLSSSVNSTNQIAGPTQPTLIETSQPKKITINRKITVDYPKSEDKEKKTDDEGTNSASEEHNPEKKVIKIGALSAEERAKLRAQKFGVPIPDNVKKAVRAERFGDAENKTGIRGNSEVDQDKLLKRQARFGIVSDETDLKKQKRAERFGTGATKASPVDDEKLRKRAERFGLA